MRFLFTTFEGGGHVPPALLVASRLAARGHEVLVQSDAANRTQVKAHGLAFCEWRRAPNRRVAGAADDPLDEWRFRWPPSIVRRLCEAVMTGPSLAYALDTLDTIRDFQPDLVVSNELLFGVMAGAEAAGAPLALLTANVWSFPTRDDIPPFGPGFRPSDAPWAQHRDASVRRMSSDWYQAGLPALNEARTALGLPPIERTLDQLDAAGLKLIGTASAFDYGASAPPGFAYAGPLHAMPAWSQDAPAEGLLSHERPNILISLSTTGQGQERLLRRCVRAAVGLPVNVIVTLGPALAHVHLPPADNLRVAAAAPHERLVPHCRVVVTQAGHGTVIRALMHGTPVVCLPAGRDQPENASRVRHVGAGVSISPRAAIGRIRQAIAMVLNDGRYADAAGKLGVALRRQADGGEGAADLLEQAAISAA